MLYRRYAVSYSRAFHTSLIPGYGATPSFPIPLTSTGQPGKTGLAERPNAHFVQDNPVLGFHGARTRATRRS
jgi:hypothetical protein